MHTLTGVSTNYKMTPMVKTQVYLGREELETFRNAKLGDLPAANPHVVAGVDRRARVEHVNVAQQDVRRRMRAAHERVGGRHASWGAVFCRREAGSGSFAPASSS